MYKRCRSDCLDAYWENGAQVQAFDMKRNLDLFSKSIRRHKYTAGAYKGFSTKGSCHKYAFVDLQATLLRDCMLLEDSCILMKLDSAASPLSSR